MRALPIAVVFSAIGFAQSPDPLLWGSLEPGPYTVGYRSYFEFDVKRSFGSPRGPRPILVNVWYPAIDSSSGPLPYRDYLTPPPLPSNPGFRDRLEAFLFDGISHNLFRKKRADLAPAERAFLDALLSRPTRSRRDAPPAPGRFPILLYHSGAAGSYEDNSVMCEYLAGNGYIVITSAFPSRDGKYVSNNYYGPEASWADMAFLLAHAKMYANADLVNTGAFGHSMGAQYLLEWLGHTHPPLGAVVSLDTTLEYTAPEFPGHRALRKTFAKLAPPGVPVLVAASADRHPDFSTWDRFLPCRAEAAVPSFSHNDFLLHGSLARAFSRENSAAVRANYDQLARTVRAFFDANLRQEPSAWQRLLAERRETFRVAERACTAANSAR